MLQRKKKVVTIISKNLIGVIGKRLAQGKQVRRTLPLQGRLHIDRTLPFLVVYRRPARRTDPGTDRLVKGEAAYLIASGGAKLRKSLSELLRTVVQTLVQQCGAFLLIEIWSTSEKQRGVETKYVVPKPAFRIFASRRHSPTASIEALENALKRIKIHRKNAEVEVAFTNRLSALEMPPLFSAADTKKLKCYWIGLEIQSIYRNLETGEVFPLVLRALHRGLSMALERAAYEFSRTQTNHHAPNYLALGRRAVVKAVWEVDRSLAEISSEFDFLLQVTPVNTDEVWSGFKRRRSEQLPAMYYRPLPVDPAVLKRKLYEIPIERIEDPTLAFIFTEKRRELDRQISMLLDRGTSQFLYGSLQLYGGVSEELLEHAKTLLQKLPRRSTEDSRSGYLKAAEAAERARREIEYYCQMYSDFSAKVQIRDDTVGLMVSRGNLLIGKRAKIPVSRLDALLQHEVGTHLLTYFNGRAQPFRQLYSGLAGYEALQEGLAVLAEYLAGGLSRQRMRLLAGRVMAVKCITEKATFFETFRELHRMYGFKQRTAFAITIRIYRGGGLTKDAIYLRGLVELLNYLKEGGKINTLFVGKFGFEHIPIVRELQYRGVLQPAPLRPRYMEDPGTPEKLLRLSEGISVVNLIER